MVSHLRARLSGSSFQRRYLRVCIYVKVTTAHVCAPTLLQHRRSVTRYAGFTVITCFLSRRLYAPDKIPAALTGEISDSYDLNWRPRQFAAHRYATKSITRERAEGNRRRYAVRFCSDPRNVFSRCFFLESWNVRKFQFSM